jgi:hypothetical protein
VFAKAHPLTWVLIGKFSICITNPYTEGERYCEATTVCMQFYQDGLGPPYAIVVHRITKDGVSSFGPGLPGEYAKWKILDTGEPGGCGDSFSLAYECYDENFKPTCDVDGDGVPDSSYDEFWPADGEPPACDDTDFVNMLPVEEGNLVIN